MDAGFNDASRDVWNFLNYILKLGVQLIKPNSGKYLTHYNGKSVPKMISQYESMLRNLKVQDQPNLECTFTQSESFVPSFQEIWIFYQISMMTK